MSNQVNSQPTQPTDDPWKAAASATVPPKVYTYFGQCFTDAFFCVLQKGPGKVPFDPTQHKIEDRRTSIRIGVQPLANSGLNNIIQREMIAESREWAGIVLPSIKALGIEPEQIDDAWVKVQMAETGASYVSKISGETVKKTTFKFLAVYPDQAACEAAAAEFFKKDGNGQQPQAHEQDSEQAPQAAQVPSNSKEREVAAKFLPALMGQAKGDPNELAKLIAGNPLTSKYFDLNSPEVVALFTVAA